MLSPLVPAISLDGTNASWCKLEVSVDDSKNISRITDNPPPAPQLVTMTIQMKTVVNPSSHAHEVGCAGCPGQLPRTLTIWANSGFSPQVVAVAAVTHQHVNMDSATEFTGQNLRWFTAVRPLGTSAGSQHPSRMPHDLKTVLQAQKMQGVQIQMNERALLSCLLQRIQAEDPDVLVSHNLYGFDFDVLLSRAVEHKLAMWSKIGRLRRKLPTNLKNKAGPARANFIFDSGAGRILCDTYLSARELVRETTYSLTNLAQVKLGYERAEIDPVDVPRYFHSAQDIANLVRHMAIDAELVQGLMSHLQILPLTKQLTNICGNLWSRTAKGSRAERIEFLLLHEFHRLKYVVPDKKTWATRRQQEKDKSAEKKPARGKPQYAGGLVLEPKKGLYETYILLLDFNSLYPSIIQEYNICFTTLPDWAERNAGTQQQETAGDQEGEEEVDLSAVSLPTIPDNQDEGIVPRVIRTIIQRRTTVKQLLKQERESSKKQQVLGNPCFSLVFSASFVL